MASWREKLETAKGVALSTFSGGVANACEAQVELLKTLQICAGCTECLHTEKVVVNAGGALADVGGSFLFVWHRATIEGKQLIKKGLTSGSYTPSIDDLGAIIEVEVSCAQNQAVKATAVYGPIVIDPLAMAKADALVAQGFAELPPRALFSSAQTGLVAVGAPTSKLLFCEYRPNRKGGLTQMRAKVEAMLKERNARQSRDRERKEEKRKADAQVEEENAIEREVEEEARMREELEQYWQQWQEEKMAAWLNTNNGSFEEFMLGTEPCSLDMHS
jgi:hypothetical protein